MYVFLKPIFKKYFEVIAFTSGLIALASMNPETANGPGFCILEQLGASFCPGDGLGHSIAYTFIGDLPNAIKANILGPFAIVILSGRILQLIYKNHHINKNKYHGSND